MKKFLMMAGVLASLVTGANATVEVRIINPGGPGTNDTGWITCADPSCSTGTIVVGNYRIASNIAIKTDGINPVLDLSYTDNTLVANPGTIVFEAMADGYLIVAPGTLLHGSGNSTLGDMITFADYGGNNNNICLAGVNTCAPNGVSPNTGSTLLNSVGPLNESAGYNAFAVGGAGSSANPYSLGIIVTLANPTNAGGGSGDIMINTVPEPASVTLFGGVLLFAVSAIRRKVQRG